MANGQSIEIVARVNGSQAKAEVSAIDEQIKKVQDRARNGIRLSSSTTRDENNSIRKLVDTYRTADNEIQKYALSISKSGKTAYSFTSTVDINTIERQEKAIEKALLAQEKLQRSLAGNRITSQTSMFAEIPQANFEAYTSGAMQAGQAMSMFAQISDEAFKAYTAGAINAGQAMQNLTTASMISSQDWQQMWNTFHNIGVECGVTANDVSIFGRLSDEAFAQYSSGAMSADAANESLRRSSEDVAQEQNQVASATENAGRRANESSKAFTLLHTVFLRLAHTAISAVTRSFREALTEMKNVDNELVVVRKVSDATAEELSALKDRSYEVGSAYGIAASDFLNAAAEMSRAGYREQAGDLAELATKIQLVGDVSQEVANKFLIATDKSYKMNGNFQKLSSTIDKLNEIDNNFATSFEKVADGIGLLAPVAAQAHVSFEEMAAAIGTVTAVTQRSGTESARALRSLYLNILRDTKTEIDDGVTWTIEEVNSLQDALKKYAPEVVKAAEATGQLINPMEAVGALAQSYKDGLLTEEKLFEIVSGLGGKLRTSQLLALIQNWDMYNQMLDKTADAAGSADKEVSNALDSWDKKLQQLKNTFTQFTQSLLDSEDVKGFIDSFNFLLKSIDNPDKFADKFASAFESAIHSIAENAPRILDSINKVATMVVKSVLSSLAKEAPDFIQNVLTDGIKDTFSMISESLPELAGDLFTVIGTLVAQGILNADLASIIANELVGGILEAIPQVFAGLFKGVLSGAESWAGANSGDWLNVISKLTGTGGQLALAKRIAGWFGVDVDGVNKDSNALRNAAGALVEAKDAIGEDVVPNLPKAMDETAEIAEGLTDKLKAATKSIEDYKKALEGGEKGDALKSYSEAYKKAVEMYEKGLTGSNQYMSAIDLLFGEVDDYEAAGELLGNAFVKAMFEGGGEDYGANAANYIRTHLDEFEGVAIKEAEDGTFSLMVEDMDAFAESTGLTVDALWTLIDALDIFDSKTTYTRDQLYDIMGLVDDGGKKFVNLTALINDLAGQGKSAREIKGIVDSIKELAETDGNIEISEPEDLDQTINDIVELNKQAQEDKDMEVVLTSNSDEFFDGIRKEINTLNGTTIYIGLKYVSDGGNAPKYASGTKSSRGGLSLVNEEGAEIIYANGKAWIAGGGDPTITNLPVGAGVFNAKETREILTRSGIESHDGDGAYVGGIPEVPSGGSGKAGKGKLTESLLEQIAEYINDILKKAKEALQEQLDAIDEQIDKLKREHDAEEDANKLEELRLKILEAEKKLAEAENERTVRYFNKETGQWEWMADQKAVAEAKKALEDAQKAYDDEVAEQEYQAQLQALQDQKDSLNEAYNQLADNWDKIYEELQDILNGKTSVDIAKLIQQLIGTQGGSYAPDIQALLEAVGAFTANPTSVLDKATTARIMSLNGTGGATSVLSAMLGSGSYDLNGKGQSTIGGNTSIVGDTIYYINGVQIGSDMMNKPLSQILSVLPIYAN